MAKSSLSLLPLREMKHAFFFFFKIGSGVAQAGFRLLILLPSVSSQVLSEWAGSLKSFSVDQCP